MWSNNDVVGKKEKDSLGDSFLEQTGNQTHFGAPKALSYIYVYQNSMSRVPLSTCSMKFQRPEVTEPPEPTISFHRRNRACLHLRHTCVSLVLVTTNGSSYDHDFS